MCSVGNQFYDLNGPIRDDDFLRKWIYDKLKNWLPGNFNKKVESILYTLRYECRDAAHFHSEYKVLHFRNGTYVLEDGSFMEQKGFCKYRFPFDFDPKAPKPQRWLAFLRDLLEEEDILTLQEYLGYCLFPTTRAQKMLMIIGSGGEGKSRIGIVMKAMLGNAICQGSLDKVEHDRFARADLENMLVMIDDDMKMEALKQTNNLKSIITAQGKMDLERKGKQSYQADLNVRFLAFGNGSIKSLHDRSYGFFRRQIILRAKPRREDRVDDPFLDVHLQKELAGIFLWCLEGFDRLLMNNFQFTLSKQALDNARESMAEGCNVLEFMESKGYFLLDPQESTCSRTLYNVYKDWCEDNSLHPLSTISFCSWLRENASRYHLCYDRAIPIGNGKYARGFRGIRTLPRM